MVEKRFGEWVAYANDAGTQAGLRESAILANIYLAALDRSITETFGRRVYYARYSDDILLIAAKRADAEGAVNAIALRAAFACRLGHPLATNLRRGRQALHRVRRPHDRARRRDGPRVHRPPSRRAASLARPTRRRLTSPPPAQRATRRAVAAPCPALPKRPPYVHRQPNLGLPLPPLQPLAAPFSAMGR